MIAVKNLKYANGIAYGINSWPYSNNWPVVYIYYNDSFAYVGETLDVIRRIDQHRFDPAFNGFTNICLISDKTFNKSVVLDLESFLIKYMSADGAKSLINGNAGIVDHDYFYREAYEDDFQEIWNILINLGVVSKTLFDITNSELFKYSPYKTLSSDQQKSAVEIIKFLAQTNNASKKSLIEVIGGAGTGKTILAVYLIKLLTDISSSRIEWETIEEFEPGLRRLASRLNGINTIGFVVPMNDLRSSMRNVFDSVDGLSSDMVISPEEATKKYYDLLIVDEAHRLYQRRNLPGKNLYARYDKVNQQLMGKDFSTKYNVALTELDWIFMSSRLQIIFYDELQRIRTPDIPQERFDMICNERLYKKIELVSQMRCKGGNGYYEYVRKVLEGEKLDAREYSEISNYKLATVESIDDLMSIIGHHQKEGGLSKVVAGPGWTKDEDIVIEDQIMRWKKDIASIHEVQGFDLNYAGVIFGKEVYYDLESRKICINKKELKDNTTKSSGDESMRRYILNIYLTLMTRGIDGTYIYAMDKNLKEYLGYYFNN